MFRIKESGSFLPTVLLGLSLAGTQLGSAQAPIGPTSSTSEEDWLRKLADDVLKRNPNPETFTFDNWRIIARMQGMMRAYEATGEQRYFDYIKKWIDAHVDSKGNVPLPQVDPEVAPGKMILMIYEVTEEPRYFQAAQKMADNYFLRIARTSDGSIVHTPRHPDQIWCDTLNGILLFFAKLSSITGNDFYMDQAIEQVKLHALHLQDKETGLFYHAWDEDGSAAWAHPVTRTSPEYWSRGVSWLTLAIPDLLDYMPESHPERQEVVSIYRRLMDGLLNVQDEASGLWFTVLDKGHRPDNFQETSGSASIVYGLARGLSRSYLDESHQENLDRAQAGLLKEIHEESGTVIVANVSTGTGVGDYDYYVNREIGTGIDYPYGDGSFLLAQAAIRELHMQPAKMVVVAGDSQVGFTGTMLPNSVKVRVLTAEGEPVSGVRINFEVLEGGGRLERFSEMITAGDGTAWNKWQLGSSTGSQTLEVRSEILNTSITFTATALLNQIRSFVFTPTDDARVRSSEPATNHGGSSTLRVRKASSVQNSYLKFDVSTLSGPVIKATLRLFAVDGSRDPGEVHLVSNDYGGGAGAWDEHGLTYDNAPTIDGSPLSSLGSVNTNQWVEIDVTSSVVGNGTYSFGLSNDSGDKIEYSSKEGVSPPELVVDAVTAQKPELPSISSFTPAGGEVGTEVTILGNNFEELSDVLFAGVSAGFQQDNGDTIRAIVPEGAITGKIEIVAGAWTVTSAQDFVVTVSHAPIPVIHTFVPASGPIGTDVTITGANLIDVLRVEFGQTEVRSFFADSDSTIHATVPPGAGTGRIIVSTSQGTAQSEEAFSVLAAGGGENKIYRPIEDSYVRSNRANENYGDRSEVIVRKTRSAEYIAFFKFSVSGIRGSVTNAQIRLHTSNDSDDGGSIYLVANENKEGNSAWTEGVLTWDNAPLVSGPALSATGRVTKGTTVDFDVTSAISENGVFSFAINNNSRDAAKYSTTESSNPPELVIACDGGSPTPRPIIDFFTPASGPTGTEVEISGSHLSEVTEVSFNGVPSNRYSVEGGNLHADVPDGATSGKITVTTPNGTAISDAEFTVLSAPLLAPVVLGFNPTSAGIGNEVTIAGENFSEISDVAFNGVSSSSFSVESEYEIRARVPAGASTGKISVSRTDSVGTSATDFVVIPGGGNETTIFAPSDDGFVRSKRPSRNYGSSEVLRVRRASSRGINATYLKFSVAGLEGAVVDARLRLFVEDDSNDLGEVFSVSNNFLKSETPWVENDLTWSNAPEFVGSALSEGEYDSTGGVVEFDVASAVNADGEYSFAVVNKSSNLLGLSSKEGTRAPELRIKTVAGSVGKVAHVPSTPKTGSSTVEWSATPDRFALSSSYPNPFNLETNIDYALPSASQVRLIIYNILGQEVRRLVDSYQTPGIKGSRWDGRDGYGNEVASGIYVFVLEVDSRRLTRKTILQK